MKLSARNSVRRGFLLLEVVLAMAVFGIAATGFVVALNQMAKTAHLAQQELRITRILESALDEAISLPTLEEGTTTVVVPDTDIEIDTTVELLKEIENQDGQLLQEMYRVNVTAHWFAENAWQERSAETWRFGRMYQP
ncbi:MAG TPA: type II secretion system protein [Luteolibacter sp.]|nr:type II secretion system protein [Luteolibacter sp.]